MTGRRLPDERIARVCYRYLVNGDESLPRVARLAGVSEDLLGKVARRERPLAPELLPRLYLATGSLDFFADLCGAPDVGVFMHRRPVVEVRAVGDVNGAVVDTMVAVGRLAADARKALEDGMLDDAERERVERDLDECARQLEAVREQMRSTPTPLRRKQA